MNRQEENALDGAARLRPMVEHLRSLLVAALAAEIRANNPHGSHNPPPALDEGPAGL